VADGVIREISGLFDSARLGYSQALVAFAVGPSEIDRSGSEAASHPGVSHCYAREADFNLWFTLAVSPESRLGLEGTVDLLAGRCRAKRRLILPSLRRYKLQAYFGPASQAAARHAARSREAPGAATALEPSLTDGQRRAVRALQTDLPNRSDPFAELARGAGVEPDMLLVQAADFQASGLLRRYAAVLRHTRMGAAANVLVAWCVGEAAADAAGAACGELPAVSHCYLRPATEDWPYNLYTMIHGPSRQDCQMTIDEIAARTGLSRHARLWTVKEYKKRRVRLFTDEEAKWERSFGGG